MKLEQRFSADEKSKYARRGVKGLLYRTLPPQAYDYLRGANLALKHSKLGSRISLARARVYDVLASNGVLSGLYYAFGSRTYDREHAGTLSARAKYLRDVFTGEGNIYVLRRNVHKLEKALVMKPRRPVFGLGYLEETVTSFADCVARQSEGRLQDQNTISWSKQVLTTYFQAVSADHAVLSKCRPMFEEAVRVLDLTDATLRVPFARSPAQLPSYESLMQLALHRRSVRWFASRPVPRDAIDQAVLLAGLSPSACNRQPFRYAIFDDPALCQEIGSIPKGTPGWLHNIPCFIVIVGTLEAFDREKDRHIPYIDGCLSAMALCFALETLGISSCCVNWPDLPDTEARMASALGLQKYERPIMCLAIGYPDMNEKVPYSQKLPLDKLRSYNIVKR
ncbi:MAG: nitroreductase family protein [Thermomicrobiales bacterium]